MTHPEPTELLLGLQGGPLRVAPSPGVEVGPCPQFTPLPGTPPWLVGVAAQEDEALAVVDLGLALGRDSAASDPAQLRMLKIRSAGFPVAFLVRSVDHARDPSASPVDLTELALALLERLGGESDEASKSSP